MIHSNIPSFSNHSYTKSLFVEYWNKYLVSVIRQFNEEGAQGSSNNYTKLEQYWLAFILVMGIKKRIIMGETLEEVEATFSMNTIEYNLQCNGINLYKLYDIFEITY